MRPRISRVYPATFTHHLTPAMLLALLKSLHHREPAGHIVSIRGYDFDFHRNLSADTEALVEKAVDHILQLHGSTLQESHPRLEFIIFHT